eukprot:10201650-Alexandrium_andersonii.AAC.1
MFAALPPTAAVRRARARALAGRGPPSAGPSLLRGGEEDTGSAPAAAPSSPRCSPGTGGGGLRRPIFARGGHQPDARPSREVAALEREAAE